MIAVKSNFNCQATTPCRLLQCEVSMVQLRLAARLEPSITEIGGYIKADINESMNYQLNEKETVRHSE